jgi:hypothetical protein
MYLSNAIAAVADIRTEVTAFLRKLNNDLFVSVIVVQI